MSSHHSIRTIFLHLYNRNPKKLRVRQAQWVIRMNTRNDADQMQWISLCGAITQRMSIGRTWPSCLRPSDQACNNNLCVCAMSVFLKWEKFRMEVAMVKRYAQGMRVRLRCHNLCSMRIHTQQPKIYDIAVLHHWRDKRGTNTKIMVKWSRTHVHWSPVTTVAAKTCWISLTIIHMMWVITITYSSRIVCLQSRRIMFLDLIYDNDDIRYSSLRRLGKLSQRNPALHDLTPHRSEKMLLHLSRMTHACELCHYFFLACVTNAAPYKKN